MQVKGGPHSFLVYSFAHSRRQESPGVACFSTWCFALPQGSAALPFSSPSQIPYRLKETDNEFDSFSQVPESPIGREEEPHLYMVAKKYRKVVALWGTARGAGWESPGWACLGRRTRLGPSGCPHLREEHLGVSPVSRGMGRHLFNTLRPCSGHDQILQAGAGRL